jgi:hypothetical protein
LPRELDAKGQWVNPLSLSDRGEDDDVVLIQNGAQVRIKSNQTKPESQTNDYFD